MVLTSAYSVVEGAVEDVAALEAGNHFAAEHYFAEAALAVVYSAGFDCSVAGGAEHYFAAEVERVRSAVVALVELAEVGKQPVADFAVEVERFRSAAVALVELAAAGNRPVADFAVEVE